MNIGIFNTRGINQTEHFIPLEIEELKKREYQVELFWLKGRIPTKEEIDNIDFAIYHFLPTAFAFRALVKKPYCLLPTANDIFPKDNYKFLQIIDKDPMCKFIGYQSFYHLKKYKEWNLTKPLVHIPHCARTSLFKRETPYNPNGGIIAGGRLIPKKGLDRLKGVENLTIFGDGPLKEQLSSIMVSCKFTGYLTGNQLKDLFEKPSIYLFPAIITPDGDSDGIPNTIKEAMLMELPVIASSVAGIPEFENVSLFDDWEHINEFLKDYPRESNIKGRKEILNNFSPEICVDKLLEGIRIYGNI